MADKRKAVMIGEDGELLLEAARPQRAIFILNALIFVFVVIIALVLLTFTLGRPAVEPAHFYVATPVKIIDGGGLGCGNWLIQGHVDAPQQGMQVRVWSDDGSSRVTLVSGDDYDLVIQPQSAPITFHVALFDASGEARSAVSDYEFAGDKICVLTLDFRRERPAT